MSKFPNRLFFILQSNNLWLFAYHARTQFPVPCRQNINVCQCRSSQITFIDKTASFNKINWYMYVTLNSRYCKVIRCSYSITIGVNLQCYIPLKKKKNPKTKEFNNYCLLFLSPFFKEKSRCWFAVQRFTMTPKRMTVSVLHLLRI